MDFFESLWLYILVFLLSAVPFIEAIFVIPIAILGGLSTVPVLLLGLLGNLATVMLIVLFIDQIKRWRKKRQGEGSESKRTQRALKLWQKYGLPGMSLIGPFFIGSHLTAFLGLIFGGSRKQITLWITISLIIWSVAFAVLAQWGLTALNIENPFLEQIFSNESS